MTDGPRATSDGPGVTSDGPGAANNVPGAASDAPGVSRRQILVSGGLVATAPLLLGARNAPAATGARTAPALVRRPDVAGAPLPEQVHLQFGADAATQIAVSWAAPARVARPRLRVGRAGGGFGHDVRAEERVYTEALSGETVYTYHARLGHLEPDTAFVYEVLHDGAPPVPGRACTPPWTSSSCASRSVPGTRRPPACWR